MLSHRNLVANVYQTYGPESMPYHPEQRFLCYLPLYHIYGLNVLLNPVLMIGATAVLMPRFNLDSALHWIVKERITTAPSVPPILNQYRCAAEEGRFPLKHCLQFIKSGAAPLAPELGRRFMELTGVKVIQGYGMTEASPVTHIGDCRKEAYSPIDSIGQPVALTECRVVAFEGDRERDTAGGEPGELVMRGPQFMMGYWKSPQATADVLRDGWYWSGDVATRDDHDWYRIVDRRKEMIKYKGFPVAPAEVEATLLEHPAVRDCGVVGRPDIDAGEIPCAFIVLREGIPDSQHTHDEIIDFMRERMTSYKRPREIRFVQAIPRNPSGKILRRELRAGL
jgi:acyl-CoA synthetase (AMP-forming)/AMP-acid ligase II